EAIRLEPVTDRMLAGFAALQAEAQAEGYRMLDTLAAEWDSGATRFNHPDEALFAAYVDGALAGIGGLTLEPALAGALRMRRFYLRPPPPAGGPGPGGRGRPAPPGRRGPPRAPPPPPPPPPPSG